jgi:hypothetical protein
METPARISSVAVLAVANGGKGKPGRIVTHPGRLGFPLRYPQGKMSQQCRSLRRTEPAVVASERALDSGAEPT